MKNALLLLSLLLVAFQVEAAPFKILSWNVFMLPKPIKFSLQQQRSLKIARELKNLDHDVLGLQEAFWGEFRGNIKRKLEQQFPHRLHLGRSSHPQKVMSSGLYILSRKPFDVLGFRYFSNCAGADCFAAKGVVLVRFQHEGKPLQVAFTHMQAGSGAVSQRIRARQLSLIKDLFDQFAEPGIPQVLMGDLNIDALTGKEAPLALNYLEMSSTPLTGKIGSSLSTLTSCFGVDDNQSPKLIDHFWTKSHSSGVLVAKNELFVIRDNFRGRHCDLSDHLPLTVWLDLK